MIGLVGWAVIFGAFLSWEGLGLAIGQEWPTLSHLLRSFTRPIVGRWVLFGLWLCLGWHLFIRGWDFFLRGPLPEKRVLGGDGRLNLSRLWSQVILPLLGTYAIFLSMLRFSARRSPEHDGGSEGGRAPRISWLLVRRMFVTVAAAYAVLLALLGLYVVLTGGAASGLLSGALTGGALLAFVVVVPGFVVLSPVHALARTGTRVR